MSDFLLNGRVNTGQITSDIVESVVRATKQITSKGINVPISVKTDSIKQAAGAFRKATSSINTLNKKLGALTRAINSSSKLGAAPRRFATGGFVRGSGSRDNVRALLTPGEYVLTRSQVRAIGRDNLRRYTKGGKVRGRAGALAAVTAGMPGSNSLITSRVQKAGRGNNNLADRLNKNLKGITIKELGATKFEVASASSSIRGKIVKNTVNTIKRTAVEVAKTFKAATKGGKFNTARKGLPSEKQLFENFGGLSIAGNLFEASVANIINHWKKNKGEDSIDFTGVKSSDFHSLFKLSSKTQNVDAKLTKATPINLMKKLVNFVGGSKARFDALFENYHRKITDTEQRLLNEIGDSGISLRGMKPTLKQKYAQLETAGLVSIDRRNDRAILKRNSGGFIPGTGNRDTVPALLTPGEFVINKRSANILGMPRLKQLNRAHMGGRVQKFARGGRVQRFANGGGVLGGTGAAAGSAGLQVSSTQIVQLNRQMEALNANVSQGSQFFNVFGESIVKSTVRMAAFGAGSRILFGVTDAIRSSIAQIISMNQAMTNLNKIFQLSEGDLNSFKGSLLGFAKDFGVSIESITEATTIFVQQGLNTSETLEAVQASILAVNAANLSFSDATELITVAVNSFGLSFENATEVIDKLTTIADSSAASVNDLTQILRRSGAAAATSGLSLEEFAAITATVRESTRLSSTTIGAGMKTILVGVQQNEKALSKYGVSIRNTDGSMIKTIDIIKKISGRWADLTGEQQVNLAATVAGKRRFTEFAAIMENFGKAQDLIALSANSSGNALAKQSAQLDTITTALARVQASFAEIVSEIGAAGGEDLIKDLVNFGGSAVKVLGEVVKVLSSISGALPAAAFFAFFKVVSPKIGEISSGIKIATENMLGLGSSANTTEASIREFFSSFQAGTDLSIRELEHLKMVMQDVSAETRRSAVPQAATGPLPVLSPSLRAPTSGFGKDTANKNRASQLVDKQNQITNAIARRQAIVKTNFKIETASTKELARQQAILTELERKFGNIGVTLREENVLINQMVATEAEILQLEEQIHGAQLSRVQSEKQIVSLKEAEHVTTLELANAGGRVRAVAEKTRDALAKNYQLILTTAGFLGGSMLDSWAKTRAEAAATTGEIDGAASAAQGLADGVQTATTAFLLFGQLITKAHPVLAAITILGTAGVTIWKAITGAQEASNRALAAQNKFIADRNKLGQESIKNVQKLADIEKKRKDLLKSGDTEGLESLAGEIATKNVQAANVAKQLGKDISEDELDVLFQTGKVYEKLVDSGSELTEELYGSVSATEAVANSLEAGLIKIVERAREKVVSLANDLAALKEEAENASDDPQTDRERRTRVVLENSIRLRKLNEELTDIAKNEDRAAIVAERSKRAIRDKIALQEVLNASLKKQADNSGDLKEPKERFERSKITLEILNKMLDKAEKASSSLDKQLSITLKRGLSGLDSELLESLRGKSRDEIAQALFTAGKPLADVLSRLHKEGMTTRSVLNATKEAIDKLGDEKDARTKIDRLGNSLEALGLAAAAAKGDIEALNDQRALLSQIDKIEAGRGIFEATLLGNKEREKSIKLELKRARLRSEEEIQRKRMNALRQDANLAAEAIDVADPKIKEGVSSPIVVDPDSISNLKLASERVRELISERMKYEKLKREAEASDESSSQKRIELLDALLAVNARSTEATRQEIALLEKKDKIRFDGLKASLDEIYKTIDEGSKQKLIQIDVQNFERNLAITRDKLEGEFRRKAAELDINFRTKVQLAEAGDDPLDRLAIENRAAKEILSLKLQGIDEEKKVKEDVMRSEFAAQVSRIQSEYEVLRAKKKLGVQLVDLSVAGANAYNDAFSNLAKLSGVQGAFRGITATLPKGAQDELDSSEIRALEAAMRSFDQQWSQLSLEAEYKKKNIALEAADGFRNRVFDAGKDFVNHMEKAKESFLGDDLAGTISNLMLAGINLLVDLVQPSTAEEAAAKDPMAMINQAKGLGKLFEGSSDAGPAVGGSDLPAGTLTEPIYTKSAITDFPVDDFSDLDAAGPISAPLSPEAAAAAMTPSTAVTGFDAQGVSALGPSNIGVAGGAGGIPGLSGVGGGFMAGIGPTAQEAGKFFQSNFDPFFENIGDVGASGAGAVLGKSFKKEFGSGNEQKVGKMAGSLVGGVIGGFLGAPQIGATIGGFVGSAIGGVIGGRSKRKKRRRRRRQQLLQDMGTFELKLGGVAEKASIANLAMEKFVEGLSNVDQINALRINLVSTLETFEKFSVASKDRAEAVLKFAQATTNLLKDELSKIRSLGQEGFNIGIDDMIKTRLGKQLAQTIARSPGAALGVSFIPEMAGALQAGLKVIQFTDPKLASAVQKTTSAVGLMKLGVVDSLSEGMDLQTKFEDQLLASVKLSNFFLKVIALGERGSMLRGGKGSDRGFAVRSGLATQQELDIADIGVGLSSLSDVFDKFNLDFAARGTLSGAEIGGLINAARQEKRLMPSGSRLMVANDSETIMTRTQSRRILGRRRVGNAANGNIGGGVAFDDLNINLKIDNNKVVRLSGVNQLSREATKALEDKMGQTVDREEFEAVRRVLDDVIFQLKDRRILGAL